MTKVLQWLSITRDLQRKKNPRQFKVLVDVNHLCLLADCMQNLPENMKPCSGPLVKIIISFSACTGTSLSTSLKSINENVCRVCQRSFACMNDLESKVNLHATKLVLHIFFLGLWTEQYLIL